MMVSLQMESATDKLDLDYVLKTGTGIQVTSGVTGFGMPPVQTRWLEGAGDGAVYRGRRALPRDIDLPLAIIGRNRAHLTQLWGRLATMLAGPIRLRLIEDDGSSWWTDVRHVGGGQYTYGKDTDGEREIYTVITVRAGNPYWTAENARSQVIGGVGGK